MPSRLPVACSARQMPCLWALCGGGFHQGAVLHAFAKRVLLRDFAERPLYVGPSPRSRWLSDPAAPSMNSFFFSLEGWSMNSVGVGGVGSATKIGRVEQGRAGFKSKSKMDRPSRILLFDIPNYSIPNYKSFHES
jgi:hypothetical protein